MAFKTLNQYQEDKQGDFFVLPNDGDTADVIFLYRSAADVLVAEGVHYLSTPTYKGYVHCCGDGCPACNYVTQAGKKGIKRDNKIFIPLYNVTKNKIEFWDRSTFFEQVLQTSVFKGFPDPSACVFRITRQGAAGSRDTKYNILPAGRNVAWPYEKILADFKISFPEGYNTICKEMSVSEMADALNSTSGAANLQEYGYTPVPRGAYVEPATSAIDVKTPVYSQPPVNVPPITSTFIAEDDLAEYGSQKPTANSGSDSDGEASGSGDDLDDVAF